MCKRVEAKKEKRLRTKEKNNFAGGLRMLGSATKKEIVGGVSGSRRERA